MQIPIRKTAIVLGTMAATAFAAPALAGDYQMPMQQQQQGRSGMMGGGMMSGGGMGMMNGGMMMGGGMGMGMQTMHALDLDKNQVQKMTEIHKDLGQKQAAMQAEMQELRWELSQELRKEEPSPEAVGKLYEQMAQKRKTMIQEHVRARNEMMGALNDKQRKQFRQMMENMQQMRMGGGPGNMPMYQDQEE